MERNFQVNPLNEMEQEEWDEFVKEAKEGDKEKKKVIDENNYVKEIKSLCYVPAR